MEEIRNPYRSPLAVDHEAGCQLPADAGQRRPTSASVFGWLAVFVGGINVLLLPYLFINRGDQMQIYAEMGYDPWVVHLLHAVLPPLFIALLAIGIGLLKVRLWARRAFVWYGIASSTVLLLRSAYVGSNLLVGVRPEDRVVHLAMVFEILGGVLLVAFALAGMLVFSQRRNREAFIAYHAYH